MYTAKAVGELTAPEMRPVVVLIRRPAGSDGDTDQVTTVGMVDDILALFKTAVPTVLGGCECVVGNGSRSG